MKLKLDKGGHTHLKLEKMEDGSISLQCNGWYLFSFNTDGTTLAHCAISGSDTGLEVTEEAEFLKVRK